MDYLEPSTMPTMLKGLKDHLLSEWVNNWTTVWLIFLHPAPPVPLGARGGPGPGRSFLDSGLVSVVMLDPSTSRKCAPSLPPAAKSMRNPYVLELQKLQGTPASNPTTLLPLLKLTSPALGLEGTPAVYPLRLSRPCSLMSKRPRTVSEEVTR